MTRRAILNVASPPRSTKARFLEHVETFCEIALNRLQMPATNQEIVVITADDVRGWRPHWPSPPTRISSQPTESRNSGHRTSKRQPYLQLIPAGTSEGTGQDGE
ncbi:hypothetical protein [Rhizobium azibense]|uniref:hypothetical protein n=1 Tax=Rhizobium azibense TaxID=1136135 RepID=UPI001A9F58B4|nr:hypothetical protein [Rhizobium azibense]